MTRARGLMVVTMAVLLGACEGAPPCARHRDGVATCRSGDAARQVASFPANVFGSGVVQLTASGDDVYALEPTGELHRFAFATGVELGSLAAGSQAATRIAGGSGGVYFAEPDGASASRLMFWDGVTAAPQALASGLDPITELAADEAGAVALSCFGGLGCDLIAVSPSNAIAATSAGPGTVVALALTANHVVVVGGSRGAQAFLVFRRDALDAPTVVVPWDDPEGDDTVNTRNPFAEARPFLVGDVLTVPATDAAGHVVLHSLDMTNPTVDAAEYASLRFSATSAHADVATGTFTARWDSPLSTATIHLLAPGFREAEPVAALGFAYLTSDLRMAALDRTRLAVAARRDEFGSSDLPTFELWFLDLTP